METRRPGPGPDEGESYIPGSQTIGSIGPPPVPGKGRATQKSSKRAP